MARSRRGALLVAVCQGRISEGIDFSDAEGRCVVLAGLPFAPAKDARVLCKKQVGSNALYRDVQYVWLIVMVPSVWLSLCKHVTRSSPQGFPALHYASPGSVYAEQVALHAALLLHSNGCLLVASTDSYNTAACS